MSNSSNIKQSFGLTPRIPVYNEKLLDDSSPTFLPSQSQQSDWWDNISDRSARKSRLPIVPKKTANLFSSSSSPEQATNNWQQYLSDSDPIENINMFKPTKTKTSDTYEQQDDNILNDDDNSLKTNKLFQDRHKKKARYSQAFNEIEDSLEVIIPETQESELRDTQAAATKPTGPRSKRKVKKAIFRKSQAKLKLSDAFVDESITTEQPELTKEHDKFPKALTQEDESSVPVTNEDTNDLPHLELTTEQTKKQLFKKSSHLKQKYSAAFAENSEVTQPGTSNKTTDPSNILPPPESTNELTTLEDAEKKLFKKRIDEEKRTFSGAFVEQEPSLSRLRISNVRTIKNPEEIQPTDPTNIVPPPDELIAEKKLFKKRVEEEEDKRTFSKAFAENESSISQLILTNVRTIVQSKKSSSSNLSEFPSLPSLGDVSSDDEQKRRLFKPRRRSTPKSKSVSDDNSISKNFEATLLSSTRLIRDEKAFSDPDTPARKRRKSSLAAATTPLLTIPETKETSFYQTESQQQMALKLKENIKKVASNQPVIDEIDLTMLSTDSESDSGHTVKVSAVEIQSILKIANPTTDVRTQVTSDSSDGTFVAPKVSENKNSDKNITKPTTSLNHSKKWRIHDESESEIERPSEQKESNVQISKPSTSNNSKKSRVDEQSDPEIESSDNENVVMPTKSKLQTLDNRKTTRVENQNESSDNETIIIPAKESSIKDDAEVEYEHLNIEVSYSPVEEIHKPTTSTDHGKRSSKIGQKRSKRTSETNVENVGSAEEIPAATRSQRKLPFVTRVENQNESSDNEPINIPAKESSIKDNAEAEYEHLNIEVSYSPVEDIQKPTTSTDHGKRSSKIRQKRSKSTSETSVENVGSAEETPAATRSQRKLPLVGDQNIKERSTKNRNSAKHTEVETEKAQDDDQNEVEEISHAVDTILEDQVFDEFIESESSSVETNEPKGNNKSKTKNQTLDVNNKRSISKSARTKTSEAKNEESEEETNRKKLRKTELSKIEDQKINKRSTLKERKSAKKPIEIEDSEVEIISTATGKKLLTTKTHNTSNNENIKKRSTLEGPKTAKNLSEIEVENEEFDEIDNVTTTRRSLLISKGVKPLEMQNQNIKKRSTFTNDKIITTKTSDSETENDDIFEDGYIQQEIDNDENIMRTEKDDEVANEESEEPVVSTRRKKSKISSKIEDENEESEEENIVSEKESGKKIINKRSIAKEPQKLKKHSKNSIENEEFEEAAVSTNRKKSKRITEIEDENEESEKENIVSEKESGKKSINKRSISQTQSKLKKHSENEESEESAVSSNRKKSKKISKIEDESERSDEENIVSEKKSGKKSINKRSISQRQSKLKKHSESEIENEESEELAVSTSRKKLKRIIEIEDENEGSETENIVSEKESGKKIINKRSISLRQSKLKKHSENEIENEKSEEPVVSSSRKKLKRITEIEDENEKFEEENIVFEKDSSKKSINKRSIIKKQQQNLNKYSENENEESEDPVVSSSRKKSKKISKILDESEGSEEENIVSEKESGKKSINKRSISQRQSKLKKHSENEIENEKSEEPAISSSRKKLKRITEIEDESEESEETIIVSEKESGKKSINKRSISQRQSKLKKHSENEESEEPAVSSSRKKSKRITKITEENEGSDEENIVSKNDSGKKTNNKRSTAKGQLKLKKHFKNIIENEESEEPVLSTSRKKSKSISENAESEQENIVSQKETSKKSTNKRSISKVLQKLKKHSENPTENEESEESAVSTNRKRLKSILENEESEQENIVSKKDSSKKSTNKRSISKGQQNLMKHSENPIENEESEEPAVSISRKKSKKMEESEEENIVSKKDSGKKSINKRSTLINQKSKVKESTKSVEKQSNTKENRSSSFRRKLTYSPEDTESENIIPEPEIIPTTSTGRIAKNNLTVRPSESSDILHFQEVENFIKNIRQPNSDYLPDSKHSLFERKSTISINKKRIVDEVKKKSKPVSKKSPIRQQSPQKQPSNVTNTTTEKQLKQKKLLDFFTTVGNNIRLLEQNKKPEPKKKTVSSGNAQMPKRKSTANLVDGKVYKPKLYKIRKWWCNDRLYSYLQKQMRNKHNDRTVIESEKLMKQICDSVTITMKMKKYLPTEIDKLKIALAKNNVIETTYDFHNFIHDYLPYEYKEWVVPIPKLYGPEIPYDRATLFDPIEY